MYHRSMDPVFWSLGVHVPEKSNDHNDRPTGHPKLIHIDDIHWISLPCSCFEYWYRNKKWSWRSCIFVLVRNRYERSSFLKSEAHGYSVLVGEGWCNQRSKSTAGVQKAAQKTKPLRISSFLHRLGLYERAAKLLQAVPRCESGQVAPKHPQPTKAKSLGYWSWWVFIMHIDFVTHFLGGFRKVDAIWCNFWGRQAIDCVTHSNASTMCSNSDLCWPFFLGGFNLQQCFCFHDSRRFPILKGLSPPTIYIYMYSITSNRIYGLRSP